MFPSRGRGPAAGPGGSGGRGSGSIPRAAAGAQEPAGPGTELCGLAALRGGRVEGGAAGHRPADHSGCQVSDSVVTETPWTVTSWSGFGQIVIEHFL